MTEFERRSRAGWANLWPLADEKGIQPGREGPDGRPFTAIKLISQALANWSITPSVRAPDGSRKRAGAEIVVKAVERVIGYCSRSRISPKPTAAARGAVRRLEQSRSKPGSGLGLSLASAVARLHGGELKLEDNHPGLKTVISLPRAASVAAVS
jgi:hypothetical protein